MFVALSTYLKPLADVDGTRDAHLGWVAAQYDAGHLLVSGRRAPATGGVIVGRAASRSAFEELLAGDPFVRGGLARYEVVEFEPTAAAYATPGFAAFDGVAR
jgi:uncharacterized protein YciI